MKPLQSDQPTEMWAFQGFFSNEAVRGCSIRLEEVRLEEALGVDPEGKRDHGVVVEVEGTKQAGAVDILKGSIREPRLYWKGIEPTYLQQGVEAVGQCTARPAEASS